MQKPDAVCVLKLEAMIDGCVAMTNEPEKGQTDSAQLHFGLQQGLVTHFWGCQTGIDFGKDGADGT